MKNLNRVQLTGLRAVEAVARLGTLATAAAELGVTVGAVSQQLRKTEDQLGVALFERSGRGLRPTACGERVAAHLHLGIAQLSAAVDAALDASREGRDRPLVVSVAPVLAAKWLVWRLARFSEAHPEIRIRIDATADFVDPDAGDVDICIRSGTGGWRDVVAHKLADQHVFPVCCPALAQQLQRPGDITAVPVIRDRGSSLEWDLWLDPNGLAGAQLIEGPVYSDASLCLDAAIAGQGVFLGWETLAFAAIEAGQLARPFPDRRASGRAYWFVTSRHGLANPRIATFQAWLAGEFAMCASPPC